MASTLKTRFLGLNTDLPATKLASGTALEALNVTLVDGKLAKRAGFGQYEDDTDGSSTSIVGIWTAHFKAGVYVVVKLSTGRFYQRKSDADSFTIISNTNGHTHKGTEPGFAFMWADRFIVGDSGGVSQWNPAVGSGVMYKAGLPQPTQSLTLEAASNSGAKDGFYHAHLAYYNSKLDVEGVVSYPYKASGGAVETRIADSEGGFRFSGAVIAPTGYECTHCRVYSTMGNTEWIQSGGVEREIFSYRATIDVQLAIGATPGMSKADSALDWSNLFTNEGGYPPASKIGCWSGAVAVYCGDPTYDGDPTASQDLVYYSKFGRPTMVPVLVTYAQRPQGAIGDDYKTIWPKGGHHVLPSPCDGAVLECVAAGGTIVLYTATSTWVMRSTPNGKLYAVKRQEGLGCAGHPAATAFGFEAHAMADRAWSVTTAGSFMNIAQNAWTTTLEDIPVAQQSVARMAAFSSADQVWCAVTKSGETTPRRILVLDMSSGSRELAIFELAGGAWESDEYITGMTEFSYAGATATMLVATNHGRIFQYPDQADLSGDGPTGTKVDFPATWRGVFGTERSAFSQKLELAEIHAGDNCSARVRWIFRHVRANGETSPTDSGYLPADNAINTCGLANKTDARYWEVELNSPPVGSGGTPTAWSVYDLILRLTRVGPT